MLNLLLLILMGFCMGRFFAAYKLPWLSYATTAVVWILLFLLGTAVGSDDRIVNGMVLLGGEGVAIALAGVIGSSTLSWLLWKWTQSSARVEDIAGKGAPEGEGRSLSFMSGLTTVSFFVAGIIAGRFGRLEVSVIGVDLSFLALGLLLILVGMGMGHDVGIFATLKGLDHRLLLLPVATIAGTLTGCVLLWCFIPVRSLGDYLAVGSGFGYYSLSSIFITEYRGVELGTIALLANVAREIVTLLGAPVLLKLWGPLAPVSSGGATSMDTTLPVITVVSGREFVVLSIFHGFIVDFSVPFLVSFFCVV